MTNWKTDPSTQGALYLIAFVLSVVLSAILAWRYNSMFIDPFVSQEAARAAGLLAFILPFAMLSIAIVSINKIVSGCWFSNYDL